MRKGTPNDKRARTPLPTGKQKPPAQSLDPNVTNKHTSFVGVFIESMNGFSGERSLYFCGNVCMGRDGTGRGKKVKKGDDVDKPQHD
jgi:hypothetical protein